MGVVPTRPDEVQAMVVRTLNVSGQLLDTAANVARIFGNTFDPRAGSGEDLIRVLQQTTAELAKASASPQAQEAFLRLVDTMIRLGATGAPLLGRPISEPSPALLTAIGESVPPVVEALEPVFDQFAAALGELLEASSPLLPAAAGLAAGLLVSLIPLINAAAQVLRQSAPELQQIADSLVTTLAPVLSAPATLVDRSAAAGAEFTQALLPALADLSAALAQTVIVVQPVVHSSATLLVDGVERIQPIMLNLVGRAGRLVRSLNLRLAAVTSPSADPGMLVTVRPV